MQILVYKKITDSCRRYFQIKGIETFQRQKNLFFGLDIFNICNHNESQTEWFEMWYCFVFALLPIFSNLLFNLFLSDSMDTTCVNSKKRYQIHCSCRHICSTYYGSFCTFIRDCWFPIYISRRITHIGYVLNTYNFHISFHFNFNS